jgi:hypothetical protein
MDVGLSLMYTPHPSYPPLDLAASGAVVVTNRYGVKEDLTRYSENILCAELQVDALVDRLRDAVRLVGDEETRTQNYLRSRIQRRWDVALRDCVQHAMDGKC